MTLEQFISKWVGKKADWDFYYGGQCVDLFRYYCHEVLQIKQPAGVWGAANFWVDFESDPVLVNNFDKVPNTADFTPKKGDVMVWSFDTGGGYGHIAICTGENSGLQYFKSFDQNWSQISYCEIVNHNYKNVYGVLRPKVNMSDTHTIPSETFEELVGKATQRDSVINQFGFDIGFAEGDLLAQKLQKAFDEQTEKIKSLEKRIVEEKQNRVEQEAVLMGKIEQLNSTIDQERYDKKRLVDELEEADKRISTLEAQLPGDAPLPQVGTGFTWREIFEIVINKFKGE